MHRSTRAWQLAAAAGTTAIAMALAPMGSASASTAEHTHTPTAHTHNAFHKGDPVQPYPVPAEAYRYSSWLWQQSPQVLERTFMAGMIPHHMAAIEMAKMELEKGQHPALKAMAQRIIEAQKSEIATMTAWLQAWYGVSPEQALQTSPPTARQLLGEMEAQMQSNMQHLMSVPAGAAFDREFMRMMIPHHQMAILEARPVKANAAHAELRAMAEEIITSQSKEIRQMRTWLHAWYGERSWGSHQGHRHDR